MDFKSFIPFLLIFLFFVGPIIFKQWQKKQKKQKKTGSKPIKKKRSGLFARIGEPINILLKEFEKQVREAQKKSAQGKETPWNKLDDSEMTSAAQTYEASKMDADFSTVPRETLDFNYRSETETQAADSSAGVSPYSTAPFDEPGLDSDRSAKGARFRSNPLQNAVVWSEILSKPVALSDD